MSEQRNGRQSYRTYCQAQSDGAAIHLTNRDLPVIELSQSGGEVIVTVTPTQFSFTEDSVTFRVTPANRTISFEEERVVSAVDGVSIVQQDPDTDRVYVGHEEDGWAPVGEFDFSGDPVLFRSSFGESDSVPGFMEIES